MNALSARMRCARPRLIEVHSCAGMIRGTRSSGNGRSRTGPSASGPAASKVMPCCMNIASRRRPAETIESGPSCCSASASAAACGRGVPSALWTSSKKSSSSVGSVTCPSSHRWRLEAPLAHPALDLGHRRLDDLHPRVALGVAFHQRPAAELVVRALDHVLDGPLVGGALLAVAPVLVGQLPLLERILRAALEALE